MRDNIKQAIIAAIMLIVGVVGGIVGGTQISIQTGEDGKTNITVESSYSLELPQAEVIETADGEIEVINATQVEAVDSQNASNLTECDENEEECGLGTYYWAPTDTPYIFYDYTKNQCWNTDGAYGGQCWDYGDLFWQNYAGRRLSTCGTGAAKGTWAGDCKYINAGNDFTLIEDPTQLQPGDWVVFNNGTWGHIGMALGYYDGGYIMLAGQNQGGAACQGGGGAVNVIKISLGSFAGAFRPNAYIVPEPEPEPEPMPENCDVIEVKAGDTLGEIMKRCEGEIKWGEAMNDYARSWKSTKYVLYPTVYDGWASAGGYGLFAGDTIERIK